MEVHATGRPQVPNGYGVQTDGPYLKWEVINSRLVAWSRFPEDLARFRFD